MSNSVRNITAIASRELRSYYSSPVAWVLMGLFAALFGAFFYVDLTYFVRESMGGQQPVNVNQGMIRQLFGQEAIVILFLMPMITMRTYAEEKRAGTIELLLTSPLKDVEIVFGKFLGAMGMYLGWLGVTVVYLAILFATGNPAFTPLLSGFLGLLLFGGSFVALGLFLSTLTNNQMVAGAASFVLFLLLWIVNWFTDSAGPTLATVLHALSVTEHSDDFFKGVIDTTHIIFYLSLIVFGLFLAIKSVDSDRWRG